MEHVSCDGCLKYRDILFTQRGGLAYIRKPVTPYSGRGDLHPSPPYGYKRVNHSQGGVNLGIVSIHSMPWVLTNEQPTRCHGCREDPISRACGPFPHSRLPWWILMRKHDCGHVHFQKERISHRGGLSYASLWCIRTTPPREPSRMSGLLHGLALLSRQERSPYMGAYTVPILLKVLLV